MGCGHDARCAIERRAEKVAGARLHLAEVNTHAHVQRSRFQRPGASKQCLLPGDSCIDRLRTGIEYGVQAIAGSLEDQASLVFDRCAQEIVVLLQRGAHRVRRVLPQMGAAFDIGEQERGAAQRLHGELLDNAEMETIVCSVYAIHGWSASCCVLHRPGLPGTLGVARRFDIRRYIVNIAYEQKPAVE